MVWLIQSGDDDYLMNETRRKPTTGRQPPSLFDKWHGIFYMSCRQGWRNEKKVGGLTLPLNDCTEAGVQGLHSEEFHDFTCSEMHMLVVSIVRNIMILHALRCTFWCNSTLSLSLKTYPCFFPPLASEKVVGLSPPPTPQSGGAKAPSAPPAPPPLPVAQTQLDIQGLW